MEVDNDYTGSGSEYKSDDDEASRTNGNRSSRFKN